MEIELSEEDLATVQRLVDSGQFQSVDEAVHVAVRNLMDEHAEWLIYARASIVEGLEDIAAGRVVDGHEVMARLKARARRAA